MNGGYDGGRGGGYHHYPVAAGAFIDVVAASTKAVAGSCCHALLPSDCTVVVNPLRTVRPVDRAQGRLAQPG